MSPRSLLAVGVAFMLVACGGTAIIDPDDGAGGTGIDDDDGSGASGAATPTGSPTGSPAGSPTGTPTGQPFEPDGIAEPIGDVWRFRVTSFPLDCSIKNQSAPFDECGWYDIEITLFIDQLVDDFVVTPGSGIGDAFFSAAGPGSAGSCPGIGGGGELPGNLTIVDVQDDRVIVELGSGWSILTPDATLSPVGTHSLARCD